MGIIQQSIDVARATGRVWDALVDYEARPRWSSRIKEAQLLDAGPLKEGSRIKLHVGRDRFTATVVEISESERLTLLVKGPGFRVHRSYLLSGDGDRTSLGIHADYRGLIGRFALRFMGGSVRRDLADELAAIKASAEAD